MFLTFLNCELKCNVFNATIFLKKVLFFVCVQLESHSCLEDKDLTAQWESNLIEEICPSDRDSSTHMGQTMTEGKISMLDLVKIYFLNGMCSVFFLIYDTFIRKMMCVVLRWVIQARIGNGPRQQYGAWCSTAKHDAFQHGHWDVLTESLPLPATEVRCLERKYVLY